MVGVTEFYETIAQLIYAFVDIITAEVLCTAIFTIDSRGNIKITIRSTKYEKTSVFVIIFLSLAVGLFFLSNCMQSEIISYLATTGWKTIPTLFAVSSFTIFWLTKIFLGRRWDFKLVRISSMVFISSILVIFLT